MEDTQDKRWEIRSSRHHEVTEKLLSEGWEPFGVIGNSHKNISYGPDEIYFRRLVRKDVPDEQE